MFLKEYEERNFVETVNGVPFKMIFTGNRGVAVVGSIMKDFKAVDEHKEPYEYQNKNELPMHEAHMLTRWLGETTVTEELWTAVMGSCPSNNGNNYPVTNVSWHDAMEFIKKLNEITGKEYDLPEEREWETAVTGFYDHTTNWYQYAGSFELESVGWYNGNTNKIMPVKMKSPTVLGLYDMSGNVYEWCKNTYTDSYYNGKSVDYARVIRGGSYICNPRNCRVRARNFQHFDVKSEDIGFRLAFREVPEQFKTTV